MPIIFTTHAKQRMQKRRMAQSDIELAVKSPDRTFPGEKPETVKFIKTIHGRRHEVIGKYLNDQKAWLVLSVWVRGEDDFNWVEWVVLLPFKISWWVVRKILKK